MTIPPSTTPYAASDTGSTDAPGGTPTSAPTGTGTGTEQAKQAASTAADEGRHVAGVAGGEARKVADEAKSQARGLMDEARGQLDDQTRSQRDRLVTTLHSVSEDLDSMASQGTEQGIASDLARQAGQRARALGEHLDGREPADLLGDVRRFARDRPGTFLLGALAAGVVAGRLARGARDAGSTSDSSPSATSYADAATTTQTPLAQPVTQAPTSFEDPLGGQDGSLGAAVPPNPTGRYEP